MPFQLYTPQLHLAPYATDPEKSRGRQIPEPGSQTRNAFQRDRDRILHSTAFRRLKHKTQVFVYHEGDHYRTRLTHSLEVSQIARSIARQLGLCEDLAEAIALSHDLGHPPFGHAGEERLDSCMEEYGGFDHNAQALRLVTKLEQKYANFDGLNLNWETLEGLVKHNGPLRPGPVPIPIENFDAAFNLELESQAGPEAQVAAIADDIAYNAHDIDDGLRAQLFKLEDLSDVPLMHDIFEDIQSRYGDLPPQRLAHEAVRRLITRFVDDVLETSKANILALKPNTAADIRAADASVITHSPDMAMAEAKLKTFLRTRMYRHQKVQRMTQQAQRIIKALFDTFFERPAAMPSNWSSIAQQGDTMLSARAVADYVSGMTDRYAIDEYHRHIGPLALDI